MIFRYLIHQLLTACVVFLINQTNIQNNLDLINKGKSVKKSYFSIALIKECLAENPNTTCDIDTELVARYFTQVYQIVGNTPFPAAAEVTQFAMDIVALTKNQA